MTAVTLLTFKGCDEWDDNGSEADLKDGRTTRGAMASRRSEGARPPRDGRRPTRSAPSSNFSGAADAQGDAPPDSAKRRITFPGPENETAGLVRSWPIRENGCTILQQQLMESDRPATLTCSSKRCDTLNTTVPRWSPWAIEAHAAILTFQNAKF